MLTIGVQCNACDSWICSNITVIDLFVLLFMQVRTLMCTCLSVGWAKRRPKSNLTLFLLLLPRGCYLMHDCDPILSLLVLQWHALLGERQLFTPSTLSLLFGRRNRGQLPPDNLFRGNTTFWLGRLSPPGTLAQEAAQHQSLASKGEFALR